MKKSDDLQGMMDEKYISTYITYIHITWNEYIYKHQEKERKEV
jgi:hypothetical protein